MRADVVVGLDRVGIDTDDQHRLIADVVGGVIAGLGNFVEPGCSLPDPAPELLILQLRERRIRVATAADAVREHLPAVGPVAR